MIFKVTVQFETEGNGQNEIVSHMDRSEVKLEIREKKTQCDISYTERYFLKKLPEVGLRERQKLLKAFLSRLFLCQNYEILEVPTQAVFRPLVCNFAIL